MTELHSFISSCRRLDDGFFAMSPDDEWRLGGVLHASSETRFAAVRKASVKDSDYEFKGLWALPGGMVRTTIGKNDCEQAVRFAVENRAAREAGIRTGGPSDCILASHLGPVVTSYTAKGSKRYTLVTAMVCSVSASSDLAAGDHSVDAACWMGTSPDWRMFAPANRLILGHLAWPALTETQRDQATEPLLDAIARCGKWANEIGLTPATAPWEDTSKWQHAWP